MGKERRLFDDDDDNNGQLDFLSSAAARSPSAAGGSGGGKNCILHTVSKYDTLAGVAIKYGVEVADIKRLNGLVTDLQMFALKTLQIPLPGRHPPSPILSNGHETPPRPSSSDRSPSNRRNSDIFDSFQSLKLSSSSERKVSPAMSSLQGYYGLRKSDKKYASEMSLYRNGGDHDDTSFSTSSSASTLPLSHHRKSKSVANGLTMANGALLDPLLSQESENSSSSSDKWIQKILRRRQKSETDFTSPPQEKLLKEESSSGNAMSSMLSKGLALRPKSANRTVSGGVDGDPGGPGPIPMNWADSLPTESANGVRKSSSTSSLQDSDSGPLSSLWPTSKDNGPLSSLWPSSKDNGPLSSLWPSSKDNGPLSALWPTSKWCLKPDFSAAIPIFDGLPKPVSRKNKAALD